MNVLEIIGVAVGVAYLYWEYKASVYLWLAGLVMPAIYLVVYYRAGLYADFAINVYYLLASFYGLSHWLHGLRRRSQTPIDGATITPRRAPAGLYLPLTVLFGALWVAGAEVLLHVTDSTVPWLDSFTTALSVVGLWMLARKYVEQWLTWIAVDAVSSGLYVYKGLYFTAVLYAAYTVIAVLGYRKWRHMMEGNV